MRAPRRLGAAHRAAPRRLIHSLPPTPQGRDLATAMAIPGLPRQSYANLAHTGQREQPRWPPAPGLMPKKQPR